MAPLKVNVPVPCFVKSPVPVSEAVKFQLLELLSTRMLLLVMDEVESAPDAPPVPNCRVPELTVVGPV